MKSGSATLTRILSTQYVLTQVIPCSSICFKRPCCTNAVQSISKQINRQSNQSSLKSILFLLQCAQRIIWRERQSIFFFSVSMSM
jgi:hypothetical protein